MGNAINDMVNAARKEGYKIGYAEGLQEFIQEGRNQMLAKLYAEKVISLEKACAEAKMTKEEFLMYCRMN